MGQLLTESPLPYAYNVNGHGYMEGERFPKPLELTHRHYIPKPDNTSRMVALAEAVFTRQQRHTHHPVGSVFFSTTAEKPPIGTTMAQQYRRDLPVKRAEVIERPIAPTTVYEAEAFHAEAAYRGWLPESLVVIGAETHMRRIKRAHRREFGWRAYRKMHFVSAESILLQEDTPERYGRFVELIHESYTHKGFALREKLFYNPVDGIPFLGQHIVKLAQSIQGESKFLANIFLAATGGRHKKSAYSPISKDNPPMQWTRYALGHESLIERTDNIDIAA